MQLRVSSTVVLVKVGAQVDEWLIIDTLYRPSYPYLLVCEDEEDGVPEFVLVQHSIQLFLGLADSFPIVAVNDEDQSLRILRKGRMTKC